MGNLLCCCCGDDDDFNEQTIARQQFNPNISRQSNDNFSPDLESGHAPSQQRGHTGVYDQFATTYSETGTHNAQRVTTPRAYSSRSSDSHNLNRNVATSQRITSPPRTPQQRFNDNQNLNRTQNVPQRVAPPPTSTRVTHPYINDNENLNELYRAGTTNNRVIQPGVRKPTVRVFHYTNFSGKMGIESSKIIRKAEKHAVFGDGVYFTKLEVGEWSPEKGEVVTKQHVAYNNYHNGGPAMARNGYVDWVVEVHIPKDEVEKCRDRYGRDCWVYKRQHLDLNDYQHSIYRVA